MLSLVRRLIAVVSESDQKVHVLGAEVRAVQLGESVTLRCASSGPIERSIEWSKVNDAMPPNAHADGGQLIIDAVRESDLGEYECRAVSTTESRQLLHAQVVRLLRGPLSSTQIIIQGGQEVRVVDAGASLALRCAASGM